MYAAQYGVPQGYQQPQQMPNYGFGAACAASSVVVHVDRGLCCVPTQLQSLSLTQTATHSSAACCTAAASRPC